jgi:BirA family biotin operon repressor/biotin-[acetyl-CoA-carboxylase] ligase
VVESHDVTIHWLESATSTNAVARDGDFAHGGAVATMNQTAGRGRQGRTWSMNPGDGLAMTIVVDRESLGNPTHLGRLPLVVAVALADLIAEARPTVKWPNDVYLGGGKVSGILVEDLGDGRLGIGVGVNLAGVPEGIDGANPVSLANAGLAVEPADFAEQLHASILRRVADLDSPSTLAALERASDTLGREVLVELPDGRSMHGVAVGLAESGALLVETEGFITELVAGDVTHLRHVDNRSRE